MSKSISHKTLAKVDYKLSSLYNTIEPIKDLDSYSKNEVLDKLFSRIVMAQLKGYSLMDIASILNKAGIPVTPNDIKSSIDDKFNNINSLG